MTKDALFDFIAIGLGPFNLGLACLAAPLAVRGLFLEKKAEFSWHSGMLLDGTTLQNPFLADLVSMADPTSRFSYLNYCKQQGRLYNYYIRENWYLSRQAFDRYCKWAAARLDCVRYRHEVQEVFYDAALPGYVVAGVRSDTGEGFRYACRKLVIGVGGVPHLPSCCSPVDAQVVHSSAYLANKAALQRCRSITVIGSGQSGAEIFQDLLEQAPQHGYELNWVTRAPRFFQMESAKLTLELITPDYGRYFFGLDEAVKQQVLDDQRSIYNGINQTLIERIYQTLDERQQQGLSGIRLLPNLALQQCRRDAAAGLWQLEFQHGQVGTRYGHATDGLVFATGYRYQLPGFIEGIRSRIRWDAQGRYAPSRHWAVDHQDREIYVQNVGLHSHGLTNPDLGLACWRNGRLLRELTGHDYYPCEARTAFQDFLPGPDGGFVVLDRGSTRA